MGVTRRSKNIHRFRNMTEPSVVNWKDLDEETRVATVRDWPEQYRELYGNTKLKTFYYKWVSKNFTKEDLPAAKAGSSLVTHLHGSYARMIEQGYETEYYRDALIRKTEEIIAYGRSVLESETADKASPSKIDAASSVNIQRRILDQTRPIIGEIEGEIDTFVDGRCKKSKFNLFDFLKRKEVKGKHTSHIVNHLGVVLDELVEVVEGKDEQLVEGYSFLTKSQQKKFKDFVKSLKNEAEAWEDHVKSLRKPRSKRVKTAAQKTSKVKYKEKDDEYGIVSVLPEKLIGAEQIWLFDTKNRFLFRYISQRGISVKGSTLKDWDEETSFKKKIRKPEVVLPELMKAGKVKLRKFMDGINAKETKVTGRINKDIVILRVV